MKKILFFAAGLLLSIVTMSRPITVNPPTGKVIKLKDNPTPLNEISKDKWYVIKSCDEDGKFMSSRTTKIKYYSTDYRNAYAIDFLTGADGREALACHLVYANNDGVIPVYSAYSDLKGLYNFNFAEASPAYGYCFGYDSYLNCSSTGFEWNNTQTTFKWYQYGFDGNFYFNYDGGSYTKSKGINFGIFEVEFIDVIRFEKNLILKIGDVKKQSPIITLTDGVVTSWASSDEDVATIDENGYVTARAVGRTTITATASDSHSTTATYTVTVIDTDINLIDGETYNMDAGGAYVDAITYTRTFNNTNWQAWYVPFEMQYDDWSADFDMAYINDIHQWDDDEDGNIDRTKMEVIYLTKGMTEANTPYLIRAKNTGEYIFTMTDAMLYSADENTFDVSSWYTRFNFKGTYSGISAADMFSNGYYAMGNGKLNQSDPVAPAILKPYRWYMQVTDRNGMPKDLGHEVKIMVLDEWGMEEETGIKEVQSSKFRVQSNGDIYDLSGCQMANGQVKKGIYVRNGKKVVIK